jgi:hypothetical protein
MMRLLKVKLTVYHAGHFLSWVNRVLSVGLVR